MSMSNSAVQFFSSSNQFRTGIQDIGWLHADHEMAKLDKAET